MYPSYMSSGGGTLQVAYEAGYEVDGSDPDLLLVSENLKTACAIQAAFSWKRIINENSGSSQKQDKKGFANVSLTSAGLIREALALVKSETRTLVGGNG